MLELGLVLLAPYILIANAVVLDSSTESTQLALKTNDFEHQTHIRSDPLADIIRPLLLPKGSKP